MSQGNRHNRPPDTRIPQADPNPRPPEMPNEPKRIAYVMDRNGGSWRLRICEIPESVVNQHTVVAHEPDVYAITSSKMHGHLDKRAMAGES